MSIDSDQGQNNKDGVDLAKVEAERLYGKPIRNPEVVGVITFGTIGVGVPVCVSVADAFGFLFGYRVLYPGADLFGVFGTLGLVAGIAAFLYARQQQTRWYERYMNIYKRMDKEASHRYDV